MKSMWDQRYAAEEFVYGREANAFLRTQLRSLLPGSILLPGEGEGRNALFAAKSGWQVEAFDQSPVARDKALDWFSNEALEMNYTCCALSEFQFRTGHYDVVGLVFFHADPAGRALLHREAAKALKPGGRIILQGFSKKQLGRNTGGPQAESMLFSLEEIKSDFQGLKTQLLEEEETPLREGPFHQGVASVINYVGIKE